MAVAVKNSSETASPGLLDHFAVASLVGALYAFAALGVAFHALPYLWWEVLAFPRTFVNYATLTTLAAAAFLALAVFGIRALTQAGRDGLKAGVFVCFVWIFAALALASGLGVALETNGVDGGIGIPVSMGLLAVLLIVLGRLVATARFEQTMISVEHQGWFSKAGFKSAQGQRVRRWTIIGILAVAVSGVWTLHTHGTLDSGPRDWDLPVPYATLAVVTMPGDAEKLEPEVLGKLLELPQSEWANATLPPDSRVYRTKIVNINEALEKQYVKVVDPGDASYKVGQLVPVEDFKAAETKLKEKGELWPAKANPTLVQSVAYPRLTVLPSVALTLPTLLLAASVWFAYRMVNVPVFADFLIATEAEMNKVSWTTRKNLITDTMVVLVTVVLLTTFLFVVDQVWAVVLTRVGVLQTPPPVKAEKNQEVPW